ncbi:MAG: pirin family protein, partial [Chloroflexi bacterium]|nr:pirin family protein [Chloroflexota bacterium]
MPAITVETPLSLPSVQVAEGSPARYRKVERVIEAVKTFEGEGFPVRRPFPGLERAVADPFVLLDEMGEVQYAPGEAKGAPDHPHRGFETVTYMIDGEFVHRDS